MWPSYYCETEVFMEASVTNSILSEASGLISTDLAKEEAPNHRVGQFQHAQWFCLEHDSPQLTLGFLTAT